MKAPLAVPGTSQGACGRDVTVTSGGHVKGSREREAVEDEGQLDRARSRLYRSQILQVNLRLKALAEIYTMHSFAQLCNLKFL